MPNVGLVELGAALSTTNELSWPTGSLARLPLRDERGQGCLGRWLRIGVHRRPRLDRANNVQAEQ